MKNEILQCNKVDNNGLNYNTIDNILSRYSEMRDSITDVIGEEKLKMLGDASPIIKFATRSVSFISQIKFLSFLKGFSEGTDNLEDKLKKLEKYINNSQNKAEFIADSISKVIFANSKKAVFVMGTMISKLIDKEYEVNHTELTCIDALSKCFDYDLMNTIQIKNFIKMMFPNRGIESLFAIDKDLYDYCRFNDLDFDSIKLTIDKLISLHIIMKETDVNSYENEMNPELDLDKYFNELEYAYKFTKVGIDFLEYISVLEKINF